MHAFIFKHSAKRRRKKKYDKANSEIRTDMRILKMGVNIVTVFNGID